MTHADVQAWLDRYVEAWQSYDGDAVAALFSEDAEYRFHPYDEGDDVLHGRDAIVDSWLNPSGPASGRDEPGTWWAHYEPWVVGGNRAVAIGETAYFADATQAVEERRYWNSWLLEFDEAGRCRRFVEYYMKGKKPSA
jgi:hypothetical protein